MNKVSYTLVTEDYLLQKLGSSYFKKKKKKFHLITLAKPSCHFSFNMPPHIDFRNIYVA